MAYPTEFTRFVIGQDDQKEIEPGKRVNQHLGQEANWQKNGFRSQAEVQAAFLDPRYGTDPEFRDAVIIMLQNSPEEYAPGSAGSGIQIGNHVLESAMANRAAARAAEDQAIYAERIQQMFADPRYEKSPSYRREVEDFIRANEAAIDQAVGHRVVDRTHQALRVELTGDAVAEARANLKADAKANAKVQAQDAAIRAARQAYFSALNQDDPGAHGPEGVSDADIINDDSSNQ